MEKVRRHIIFHGYVQGVGFRYTADRIESKSIPVHGDYGFEIFSTNRFYNENIVNILSSDTNKSESNKN